MIDKDTIVQLAREEAGFVGYGEDMGHYTIPAPAFISRLETFAQSVYRQALEDAAYVAEQGFRYAKDGYQIADDIRALKEPT